MEFEVDCPFCGEPGVVIDPDVSQDDTGHHVFVQDCEVCCRPWQVQVTVSANGQVSVSVDQAS